MESFKKLAIVIVSFLLLSGFLSYPTFGAVIQSDNGGSVNLQDKPDKPADPFE